ncbi:hypothetical protein [Azospirillum sp. Marseille-Q6669]
MNLEFMPLPDEQFLEMLWHGSQPILRRWHSHKINCNKFGV